MKRSILLMVCFLYVSSNLFAQHWENIVQEFQELPTKMKPTPLWFWNDTRVEPEELRKQMYEFKKAGYGGLSILPFGKGFKPEYLTEEYFKAYQICVEEAKKLGITLCIYDEYGFPSGTAGDINGDGIGRFKLKHPAYTNKRLDKTEHKPSSESYFEIQLPNQTLMAVVAMDTVTFERIDLSPMIQNDILKWNVPSGAWKIMSFHCVDAGNSIVDYLDPEAADLFIQMTHNSYYERFSSYFGNVIEGTFFDEPTLYYAEGRTWTPNFNHKFEAKYGFSPAKYYPALWYNIGEETTEARNYLFGFRSDLYAQGYIKQVNEWSKKHGVYATGHQDNEEVVNCVGTSGDFMKCFQHLDVPGIDKIGGNRPAENFYKLTTSSAYNWDHSYVMSETYGAMGNIGWNEIFSIAMDQYVKGINRLIPHAVWYNTDKITFLPELSLRNPIYADSLPVFLEYLTRLNVLLKNEARWVGDIAILYPIHTMQNGHFFDGPLGYYKGGVEIPDMDYINLTVCLFDSLGYDHLFIHPDILDERCVINNGNLELANEIQYNTFNTLLVPSCETISLQNLQKIQKMVETGGVVIFTTRLPSKATLKSEDEEVQKIVNQLLEYKNVYFIKELSTEKLKATLSQSKVQYDLTFTSSPVRNMHKIWHEKHIWFLANPDGKPKTTEFILNGSFDLEVWNPHSGEISETPRTITKENGSTQVKLKLPAYHSLFLIQK